MDNIKFKVALAQNGCFRVDFAYPSPVSGSMIVEHQDTNIQANFNNLTYLVVHIMAHISMLQDNMKKAARDSKKKDKKSGGKSNGKDEG